MKCYNITAFWRNADESSICIIILVYVDNNGL